MDATIIPRMMVTSAFSNRAEFSVRTPDGWLQAKEEIVEISRVKTRLKRKRSNKRVARWGHCKSVGGQTEWEGNSVPSQIVPPFVKAGTECPREAFEERASKVKVLPVTIQDR